MNSFKCEKVNLPLGSVWLMNSVAEYKGKQEIFAKQPPQILKTLLEIALIESVESSNRIEGVTVAHDRLKSLIIGHSKPQDRSEEEVAGYRKALDFIHKKYQSLRITPETIQKLHLFCRDGVWDAGEWKKKDNDIIRKYPDGQVEVIFKPVSAAKAPKMMQQLCLAYENSVSQLKYPELYAVACLVLDFLSIHPFRDGNGRVGRLLTLLALYQHGFMIGKYVSLERTIEQSKETYYETLNKSSQKWHEAKHDIIPWFNYFLGTVLSAYKELDERAGDGKKPVKGAKREIVIYAIGRQISPFSIGDIERECSTVSRDMIRVIFRELKSAKKIKCLGKGKSAKWEKI